MRETICCASGNLRPGDGNEFYVNTVLCKQFLPIGNSQYYSAETNGP